MITLQTEHTPTGHN